MKFRDFPRQKHINQVLGQIFVKRQMVKKWKKARLVTSSLFHFIYVNLVLVVPDSCYSSKATVNAVFQPIC